MEERACKRMAVQVGCWLVEMDGASCFYTFDLSEGGVCVNTDEPLPVGRVVTLQFFTPKGAAPVTITAEVVWSRLEPSAGMGLRFTDLDPTALQVIKEFTALLQRRHK
ncbi:PilZ domain-containing protein [Geomobilimonas luticola]|uniref:PilZ domain-containing protein n=1 Tax=Geomobilimonas luticola TaxID=1114878 RepID=A0ABS5SDD0_9BACT|nr:PilZ domain-containing protein [Geomobilimonas luticola]MBT0653373.1 PilZ domain-containing protein [Geomobilimonas luticola]